MKYYFLEENKDINMPLSFNNFTVEESKNFNDIIIETEIKENTKEIDFAKKSFLFDTKYIFSDNVKDIFDNEKGCLKSRVIFLNSKKKQLVYWEIRFINLDCAIKVGNQIKLMKNKISDYGAFTIQIDKFEYLVFRIDTAERFMKKFPLGVRFKLVDTI